jgi:hypothetical protein
MDIWNVCDGAQHIAPIGGTALRMVESQEQVATTRLVDLLDKQQVLEELLEATKPPWRAGTEKLHYLLATPFRYPPLRHGSRFGRRDEPALFYAALTLPTLLAEAAYYRFVFWQGMSVPPSARLKTQHSVFELQYASPHGVRLQAAPFDDWHAALTDPVDYRATQALGRAMRTAGVAAFEYPSARDAAHGVNVALFSPTALAQPRPGYTEQWLAETSGRHVRYLGPGHSAIHEFSLNDFAVEGQLPHPAHT